MKNASVLKLIAIAMCALFLIQGTLAWQNIRQTAVNEMYFESDYSPVRLVKYEKYADGSLPETPVLLAGAEFELRYYNGPESPNPYGDRVNDTIYITDEKGEIRLEDKLAPGAYVFVETKCPPGYTFDTDENGVEISGYTFVVSGDKTEVLVEAYNRRMTDTLIVSKTVATPDGSELTYQHTQQEFNFTLKFTPVPAPTDVITYTITDIAGVSTEPLPLVTDVNGLFTFTLRHGDTMVINGIPTDTLYEVSEADAPGYVTTSTGTQGIITAQGARADFTNTIYQDPTQTGELIVKKFIEPEPSNTQREEVFSFYLELPPYEDGTRRFEEFTLRHGEEKRFTLPAGTVVSVREGTPPIGYYPAPEAYTNVTIPAQGVIVLPFINQYNPNPNEPGSLRVSKTVATPTDLSEYPAMKEIPFSFEVKFSNYPSSVTGPSPYYTITRANGSIEGPTSFDFSGNGLTFTLCHGDAVTFGNIPHGVRYTVTERPANGFTANAEHITGTIVGGLGRFATADFVNFPEQEVPIPPDQLHDLYVTKLLKGKYSDEDLTPEQWLKDFEFTLTLAPFTPDASYNYIVFTTVGEERQEVSRGTLTLDEKGQTFFTLKPNQTIQIIGIPQGTHYTIREKDYYTAEQYRPVVENFDGTMGSEDVYASVTNIYDGEVLVNIPGDKTWKDVPSGMALPSSVRLQLMNGDTIVQTLDVFPKDGKWEYVFTDVPKYDGEGNLIEYTINEDYVPGFVAVQKETTYDELGNPTYHLENVYVPPVTSEDVPLTVEKSITVTKEDETAPQEVFEFILSRRSPADAPMPGGAAGDQVTITITGEGEADFPPITFTNPGTYVYTIEEKAGSSVGWSYDHTVYIATYEVTFDEEDEELKVDLTITEEGSERDTAEFTNEFDPEEAAKYVSIAGKKVWDHKDNPVEKRPQKVVIRLLANGEPLDSITITPADNWEYLFANLPLFNEETGETITYTIEEERIPNYVPTYTKTDNGYDILNTYTPMVEVQVPLAVKKIQGTNPPAETFYFILEAIGGAPMPEGAEGARKTMSLSGAGTVNFGTIHYEKAGIYEYVIYERQGDSPEWMYDDSRYTLTVTVTETAEGLEAKAVLTRRNSTTSLGQATFTNLYNKAGWDEQIVIEGTKYWDHGDNPKLMRPTTIRVFLYGNGQYVAEKQVSEADGWTYMFIVPKYTAGGEPITYVIDELEIEGYSKHIDGYDLFNTFVGEDSFPDPEPPQLPSFSPATGDNSNLPLWIGIFAASTIGMGVLLFFALRSKDKSSKNKRD